MSPTTDHPNNQSLRELLRRAGLKTAAAITLFNRGRLQPVAFSTWSGWIAPAGSTFLALLPDGELAHAERVFGELLMPG